MPVLLLAFSLGVGAQESRWREILTGINPYAQLGFTHDSNLLYMPDGDPDEGSDDYHTLEIGFDADLTAGQQQFLLNGRVYRNDYDRFDEFDYTAGDAQIQWNWVASRLWNGALGYEFSRKQRDYANQETPIKDLRDRHKFLIEATRRLTERWRTRIGGDWSDITFSETDSLDKELLRLRAALDYVSSLENYVGMSISYMDSSFSNADDRDFEEWVIGPEGAWKFSNKLRATAQIGYLSREHEDTTLRSDFDGLVARALIAWRPSFKTSLKLKLERDVSNLDDEVADYAVVHAITLEPRWDITPKTALRLKALYEDRDFRGGTGALVDRQDDMHLLALWLDWQASRGLKLSLGYGNEQRESNRAGEDYDKDYAQFLVRVSF